MDDQRMYKLAKLRRLEQGLTAQQREEYIDLLEAFRMCAVEALPELEEMAHKEFKIRHRVNNRMVYCPKCSQKMTGIEYGNHSC